MDLFDVLTILSEILWDLLGSLLVQRLMKYLVVGKRKIEKGPDFDLLKAKTQKDPVLFRVSWHTDLSRNM